jgi:excisionase family DNA binding protein
MTIQEAIHRLGKSESTIRRHIKSGKLQAEKIDGAYDIPEGAIQELVNDKPCEQMVTSQVDIDDLRSQVAELQGQVKHLTEGLGVAMTILSVNVRATQKGI